MSESYFLRRPKVQIGRRDEKAAGRNKTKKNRDGLMTLAGEVKKMEGYRNILCGTRKKSHTIEQK